jgi:formate C-acetyltransferase
MIAQLYTPSQLENRAKALFDAERSITRLDGWMLVKEQYENTMEKEEGKPHVVKTALATKEIVSTLPLSVHPDAIFVGTQRDAFARSYALINPSFRVDTFAGYCDPTAVFGDVEPNEEFNAKYIEKLRKRVEQSTYVKELNRVYEGVGADMEEVAYFVEQVTGHLIPDFRYALTHGIKGLKEEIGRQKQAKISEKKKQQYQAMEISLDSALVLTKRYQELAKEELEYLGEEEQARRMLLIDTLDKVPYQGATTLYEAIQSFILLWQVMCLEQAPNPFAFSVGNADRIFEPYREKENLSRELAAGLFQHFLVFFNVGDRSWAISQNIIVSGKNEKNEDLTNLSTYALLDAYYTMNLPQPILSVKLHRSTPVELYQALGRFFFTAGMLTPSLFNDDAMFALLKKHGVEKEELADYSIAGCQEPLIMGKDNGNTTNSWLNLAKILELSLNDGKSLLTGKQIGPAWAELGFAGGANEIAEKDKTDETDETGEADETGETDKAGETDKTDEAEKAVETDEVLSGIREVFYSYLDYFVSRMIKSANGASLALSNLPVPFLSCFMGGIESGIDLRDGEEQGTKYNGSGCLIHGLTVVADSFVAIDELLKSKTFDNQLIFNALQDNFVGYEELHTFLLKQAKFGNNETVVDDEAREIAKKVSALVREQKNYLGNPFKPDFSTPSTHLIYGSLVGALPSGRKAREMLNYGIDPLYGEASAGLGFRVLSTRKLPYEDFIGGYASHLGLDPKYFKASDAPGKGVEFRDKVIEPLFFYGEEEKVSPYYLYVNVTTPETLRKVLENPKKYAPSGVYIMRIHGTFVNFLDLSPEIQEDIIRRLDLHSTVI